MEPKNDFKFKLKILEISNILNSLYIENLKRIINILDLEANINSKEAIIDSIIDKIKQQDKEEINSFLDIIENLRLNQNNSYNNKKSNETVKYDENDKSECSELSLNSKFEKFNLNKNKPKKRTYNEMINNSLNLGNDLNENEDEAIKNKGRKKTNKTKKEYNRFLNNIEDKHYYYIDNNNDEWEYLEINGTSENFYFKCSCKICCGFGMIKRNDNEKKFKVTKKHNLEYYKHPYYIKYVSLKNIIKNNITDEQWKEEKIRYNLFKTYFIKNHNSNDEDCKLFFKEHLQNIFVISDEINKEIKKSRISANYVKSSYNNIIFNLENLKDINNNNIVYINKYNHYNKITKEEDEIKMYFIMNKKMCEEIKNNDIFQYFGDATYRCVPPTMRNYKLYTITGFNFIIKRTRLLALILIPNETLKTYMEMFNYLKNNFNFNPKIFTMDFNKASGKAIKTVFPEIYLIKCFFHYVYNLWKHFIKYGLKSNINKKDLYELAFNLKMLCFVKPDNVIKIYKKIVKKYNKPIYKEFFNYYERTWKPKGNIKNIKFIQDFNYYNTLNSIELDIKYLFLTNNISEHLNKLLNAHLNSKYPVFDNWKHAILKVEEAVNNNMKEYDRSDYISRLFLYFIAWNNKNKSNIDLLNSDDIKKLNTILIPGSNIGNLIPFSEFFNLKVNLLNNNKEGENLIDKYENSAFCEKCSSDISSDSSDEQESNDDISSEQKEDNNEYNLFNNFAKNKDLCYNVQKYVNSYNLKDFMKDLDN